MKRMKGEIATYRNEECTKYVVTKRTYFKKNVSGYMNKETYFLKGPL